MSGAEIRAERLAKGIKQRLLAAYAGIDPAHLSRHERREEPVTESTSRLLEEGLRVIPLLPHKEIQAIATRGNEKPLRPAGTGGRG